MLELNAQVDWHPPEVGAGRFGEWLENNVDWALSRDRYWGTPLPVWVCDRDPSHVEVIGSYAELAERWGQPLPDGLRSAQAVHRRVHLGRASAAAPMRRTPEVIDTWFDSGSMPYAQWHYPFEHEDEFAGPLPGRLHLRGRGPDARLVLLAAGDRDDGVRQPGVPARDRERAGARRRGPEDVEEPRATWSNPWEMIEEFGADTVRLYLLASSQVWLPKRFDRSTIPDVAGKFFNTLKNSYGFFAVYAGDWTPGAAPARGRAAAGRPLAPEPARRHGRGGAAPRGPSTTRPPASGRSWSSWWTTCPSGTCGSTGPGSGRWTASADPAALATLHEALVTVSRLLAPAAPFVSDWLHRALAGTSVHLARFPVTARPAGARRWRPRWTRCAGWPRWPTARGRSGSSACASRSARMQVAVPGRGARARRSTSCSSCSGSR